MRLLQLCSLPLLAAMFDSTAEADRPEAAARPKEKGERPEAYKELYPSEPAADNLTAVTVHAEEWRAAIHNSLKQRAKDMSSDSLLVMAEDLPKQYVGEHIDGIEQLGYYLSERAKVVLREALDMFYKCDIGPAPFSLDAIAQRRSAQKRRGNSSGSLHGLAMGKSVI
jgi:hypothetical protein